MKPYNFAKFLVLSTLTMFAANAFAEDEFGGDSPGIKVSGLNEQFARDKDNFACKGNLCSIFSVNVNKRKFTIGAYAGVGPNGSSAGYGGIDTGGYGSTGYGGYGGSGGGLNGGGGGYGGYYGNTGGVPVNASLYIQWEDAKCAKNINVDRSVYDAVTTYMRSLVNPDGTTKPVFTPSEQTMLLFYATIMKLTEGFSC